MDAMIPVSQPTNTANDSVSSNSQSGSSKEFEKLLQDNSSSSGTDTSKSDTSTTQTETTDTTDSDSQSSSGDEITDTQRELMAGLMMTPELMYRTVEDMGEMGLPLEQDVVEEVPEIMVEEEVDLNLGNDSELELFPTFGNSETEPELNLDVAEEGTEELVLPEEVLLEVAPEEVIEKVEAPQEVVDVEEPETDEPEESEEVAKVETSETTESRSEDDEFVAPVKSEDDQHETGTDSEADAELLGQNQQSDKLFDKVESTPIKVAETVNTQDPDMDTQMAKIIQDANDSGESTVIIRMSPESLGSVTAQITQTTEGTLHVVLQAADDVATALLKNHIGQLVQAFQAAGQTVTVEIARSEEAEQSNQDQENADQNQKEQHQEKEDQQEEQEFVYSDDFMQQLRLGLTGFNLEIL